jgi:hypothetical protein
MSALKITKLFLAEFYFFGSRQAESSACLPQNDNQSRSGNDLDRQIQQAISKSTDIKSMEDVASIRISRKGTVRVKKLL